jgi:hypothetical protein
MLLDQVRSKIETLQNEDDFVTFVEKNHGSFFRLIPKPFKTFHVCKKAVQCSGNNLAHVDLDKFDLILELSY